MGDLYLDKKPEIGVVRLRLPSDDLPLLVANVYSLHTITQGELNAASKHSITALGRQICVDTLCNTHHAAAC